MLKKLLLLAVFTLLFAEPVLAVPGDWWGSVKINDRYMANGSTVTAYVNGNITPAASSIVGSLLSNYYLVHVEAMSGDSITFKVNNIPVEQSAQSWSEGDHELNLSIKTSILTVNKILVPSGDTGKFNLRIDSTDYATDVSNGGTTGAVIVSIGSHTVSEIAGTNTILSDYVVTINGNCGSDGTITLAAGQEKTCTITNTKKGKIIVDKVTNPSRDSQSFTFTPDYGSSFDLTDASTPHDSGFLVPGSYSVSETVPSGWDLTSATCDNGNNPSSITVNPGQTITCTFENTKRGTIIVEKQTLPDGAPGSFTFTGTAAGTISDNGQIVVSDLVPGTYTSTESDPTPSFDLTSIVCDDGSSQTPSSGDVATRTATFKVDPGETVKCVFTNYKLAEIRAEIRGIKFEDVNGNGVKDAGEKGLRGWTIYIDKNNNGVLDPGEPSAGTGADGSYILRGLSPDTYTVREVVKKGWIQTMPADGYTVTVSIGSVVSGNDFGNFELGSISGIKFRDTNGNGIRDSGEIKLPGWTIYLDTDDDGIRDPGEPFIVTDRSGRYEFAGLLAGTYHVREVLQDGWVQTTPADGKHTVTIVSGSEISGKDFGNRLGEIRGIKFEDVNGNGVKDAGEKVLQGWKIYLDLNNNGKLDTKEPSKITDKNGEFWFMDLAPGTYTVREVMKNGWVQTSPVGGKYTVEITNGNVITGKDFGNAKVGSISGIKFLDTNGNGVRDDAEKKLSGWKIYLDLDNNGNLDPGEPFIVTGSNGKYEFASLTPGTYNVREVLQSGWVQTTPAGGKYIVTILSGSKIIGNDFGNKLGEIRGIKFEDLDGHGIMDSNEKVLQGWKIYLDLNNNEKLDSKEPSDITDRNGEYLFSDLAPGTYTVREVMKNGWVQTAPADGKHVVVIGVGTIATGKDFGNAKVGSISGIKFLDTNGNGFRDSGDRTLQGWTIYIDKDNDGVPDPIEPSTITSGSGTYKFTNLSPGTCIIREVVKPGWVQTLPSDEKYTVVLTSGSEVTGKNFANRPV